LNTQNTTLSHFNLFPENYQALAVLCGVCEDNLRQIEQHLRVTLYNRGHHFKITGPKEAVPLAARLIKQLYQTLQDQAGPHYLAPEELSARLNQIQQHYPPSTVTITHATPVSPVILQTPRGIVRPQGINQTRYLERIRQYDINFAIGPAGTGKTYLAVASAVAALETKTISRIVLVRPAVEAGEKLGFLPGDFAQKLDPFFRPLYDALYEMLGFKQVMRFLESHVIEVAPLAYMRGRTLNEAFVILDEAQNTSPEQMKMFLTRIGLRTKVVVSGDITQSDLPPHSPSGLRHCLSVLKAVKNIGFTYFNAQDIVRHNLVQVILEAYAAYESDVH
jgi:phosphate starvation-inducible protein PhoH and related proteins